MRTTLDCVPCLVRQALEVARLAASDPTLHERVLRETLRELASIDLAQSPPLVASSLHRRLRQLTGQPDPYRQLKERFNQAALALLPALEARIRAAAAPFELAVRLAAAGNMIDFGAGGAVAEAQVRQALDRVLEEPFLGDLSTLRAAAESARRILYLADNAGEIVLDRLLLAALPPGRVTVVVRGAPVINDATLEDARAAGLDELAEVIDNGSDVPGTVLAECSPELQRRFREADLILAKGQGNYETLSDEPAPLFFLLKVKCPVVAAHLGHAPGTHLLLEARRGR
jgi:uncharacterized protein with ATP-grasp and redox domains